MKKSYTYLTMLLTVFALASCVKEFDNEDSAPAKGTMPIEFTIADDATRTLLDLTDGKTVTWKDGDQVGLVYKFKLNGDNQYPENAHNIPYEYDEDTGKFKPVGEPAYWDAGKVDGAADHALYVYYPYNSESVSDMKMSVSLPVEQTYDVAATSNPIVAYGCGGARFKDNVKWGQAVDFPSLGHSLAMLRLNITNNMDIDAVIREVKISNSDKAVAYESLGLNLASFNGSAAGGGPQCEAIDGESKTITVNVENGKVSARESIDVRMMIFPQDYSGSTFTVTVTSDRGEHPVIMFGGGEIVNGGRVSKNVELQALEYPIGSVIDGGILYKIGDNLVGYVLYPYASQQKWIDSMLGTTVGINNFTSDGREAVAAMKATETGISNYPAAKYCDDLEGDWYLPSQNELCALFDVYTGNDKLDDDQDREYFKKLPNLLDQKYLDARKTFDGYFRAFEPVGDILNTAEDSEKGDVLWSSSTASSNKKARYIRFGHFGLFSSSAPTTKQWTRCIKRVLLGEIDESVEQTCPAPAAGTDGEYDVYLLIGQSNMAGRGELVEGDEEEIENVYILNEDGEIVPATNPLNIYSTIRKANSEQKMNPGSSFASTIAAQTCKKVLLVVNARGGSAIAQWQKGVFTSVKVGDSSTATSLSFYEEAVTRTKQAMQHGALKGILWHQGCSDSSNANYLAELRTLVNNLRSDLGADVPFIAGQLGGWRSSSPTFNANIQTIGKYLTYSDWVSSEDCVPIAEGDPHFDRASQILMGKRYAQKILKMVYGTEYTVD